MSDSTNTATSTVHASTDRASSRRREEDDSDVEVDLEANPNEEAELAAMRARGEWIDVCAECPTTCSLTLGSQSLKWKLKRPNCVN